MRVDQAEPQAAEIPALLGRFAAVEDEDQLLAETHSAIRGLLRRDGDRAQLDRTLSMVSQFFAQARRVDNRRDRLNTLKLFSREAVKLVLAERSNVARGRTPVPPLPGRPNRRATDIDLTDPLTAAEIEEPTTIVVVPPPPPETRPDFASLLPAALGWRIRQATTFFHRRNPGLVRELPPPFLLSPAFENRLLRALEKSIVPAMVKSGRSLSVLGTMRAWENASTAEFWDFIESDPSRAERIHTAWMNLWGDWRQERAVKLDKATGSRREVWVAPTALKDLREALAPGTEGEYDIPPLRNREIDLLSSLLGEFDRDLLDRNWQKLRQIYEQEMDRRWYQDKARQGALRDSLLEVFAALPDRTGEFLAILCYYNFPHINLHFLDRFTHNKGRSHHERVEKVPYLMRFLADERVQRIRDAELAAERERQEALKARRSH